MRVLDLGCGVGKNLTAFGVAPWDKVTGIDIDSKALAAAAERFPKRIFLQAAGEYLPFEDASFDRVVSEVALPYMKIPKVLAELHRVLRPGGKVWLSVHPFLFTAGEVRASFPRPLPTLFRCYVMANGLFFHCTGRTIGFLRGRTESFQTERGLRIALGRAGFENLSFSRPRKNAGRRLIVEATKPPGGARNSQTNLA